MTEIPAETPAPADVPVASVTVPAPPAEASAPAPEPAAEPAWKTDVARLIGEARGHLSGGIPQSAVTAVIDAVEILAGL